MTKKERRIFSVCTIDDWQEIVKKHIEKAKGGDISSTSFLFNRVFGVPKTKEQLPNENKPKQLELDFSKLSINDLQQLDKITDKARVM